MRLSTGLALLAVVLLPSAAASLTAPQTYFDRPGPDVVAVGGVSGSAGSQTIDCHFRSHAVAVLERGSPAVTPVEHSLRYAIPGACGPAFDECVGVEDARGDIRGECARGGFLLQSLHETPTGITGARVTFHVRVWGQMPAGLGYVAQGSFTGARFG